MRLYVDDDSIGRKLIALLRKAGHDVVLPRDAGTSGVADPKHMLHALRQRVTVLTRNYEDFEDLHMLVTESGGHHQGVLVIRSDNDRARDMKPAEIVTAIGKLEAAQLPFTDHYHILNHWR